MKKKIIIYSERIPSQGMLTLTKYLFGALIYANNSNNKNTIKLLIYHENFLYKIKKFIYNAIKLISLKKNFSKKKNPNLFLIRVLIRIYML